MKLDSASLIAASPIASCSVQRQRALLIVHVCGAVGAHERLLAFLLGAAPQQVAVELVFEEPPHPGISVLVLQHHQRRVFGQALGDELGALHVGGDLLVRPPLARNLVRGDEVRIVDVLGIAVVHLGGEADRLVERHRIGERLREPARSRESWKLLWMRRPARMDSLM